MISLLRPLSFSILLALAAGSPVHAADKPMPKTLVIGYENEGKIDASEQACREFVTQTVEWDKAQTDQAVKDVCALRKKHVDAYAALQDAYKQFRTVLAPQTRFDGALAVQHLAQMINSCIEHKWAISTGGHNIGLDMVPNDIDTQCLEIGRDLLVKETTFLMN
jgi:hypothetical protein